jgi:hypothetical protein
MSDASYHSSLEIGDRKMTTVHSVLSKVKGIPGAVWSRLTFQKPEYTKDDLYKLLLLIFDQQRAEAVLNFELHLPIVLGILSTEASSAAFVSMLMGEIKSKEEVVSIMRNPREVPHYIVTFGRGAKKVVKVMYKTRLEEIPLHVAGGPTKLVAQWRLDIGK